VKEPFSPIVLTELASENGHSERRLIELAAANEFPGAQKVGKVWYYFPVVHLLELQRGEPALAGADQEAKSRESHILGGHFTSRRPRKTKLPYRRN